MMSAMDEACLQEEIRLVMRQSYASAITSLKEPLVAVMVLLEVEVEGKELL